MIFCGRVHTKLGLSTLLALFFFQALNVEGWTFPRQRIRLVIPEDYPLNVPFYRLAVIPSKGDVVQNTVIDYSIRQTPFRKSGEETSALKREKYIDLDKRTGILRLIKKLPGATNRGRRRHKMFINITLSGFSKLDKLKRKFEISVEFVDTLENYCTAKESVCFQAKKYEFYVPEDSINGATIEHVMNPGQHILCPNMSLQYSLLTDGKNLALNQTAGVLQIVSEVDAEERQFERFRMVCTVENEEFVMPGSVVYTDVNDNAPTTQSGNSTEEMIFHIKPYQRYLNFAVSAFDRDSKYLNNMEIFTVNDTLQLFKIKPLKEYENIEKQNNTFLYADIHSEDLLQHTFSEYNFSVVIEDKGLQQQDRKVIFKITVIRENYDNLKLQDVYEVNVTRKASEFARVLQISTTPLNNIRFTLANLRKNRDWLNITAKSGIVFIQHLHLMTNKSQEQRKIMWLKKNTTHSISGTSILIINIDTDFPSEICYSDKWCSFYGSKEKCLQSCGKGSFVGKCSWRQEPSLIHPVKSPTPLYSACSPDLLTCPDGHCDELEVLEPTICPLDCAKETVGTAIRSSSTRGVEKARGVCSCSSLSRCNCAPPPEELRFLPVSDTANRSFPETKNLTMVDPGKRLIARNDETSTPYEIIPGFLTGGTCDVGCVLLISIAPCAVVFLVVTIYAVRKLRTNHVTHLKAAGSHISLSAVPSDYVQDRPSSVQDTRTTGSESSTLSKTVLDPKWEFPRNRLQFQTILGEGEFGKVVKAQATNISGMKGLTTVAVKMLKENGGSEEMQDLISEFTLLKDISHPNVIKLLGACTEKGGPFYLIVEYAEMGSLRSYLRKRRKHNNCCKYNPTYDIQDVSEQPPREYYQFVCERSRHEPQHSYFHKEQLSYAWQIAKGMAYLADMKLVHRDLAARNILLTKSKVAKISDFGLSRDVYKGEAYLKKTKGRVPVKWLAIESLEDQIYTSRSDVWSFGIVLWEIMMQGATPYPAVTPQRLFNLLKAGYRMSKPDNCPDELYVIMRQCWKKVPHERPSFKELVSKLDSMLQETVEYMNFEDRNMQLLHQTSDKPLMTFDDAVAASLNYTSVLVGNDEEWYDLESPDSIGLANLFSETETKPSNDQESNA